MAGSQRKQNAGRGMKQSRSQKQCANKGQGMNGRGKSPNRQGGQCTPIDRQKNSEKGNRLLDQKKDDRQVLDTTTSESSLMITR
jgi:hypothetical protein